MAGGCDNGADGGKRTRKDILTLRQKARLALLSKNPAKVLKARKILRRTAVGNKKDSEIRSLSIRLIEEQARNEKLQNELKRAREGQKASNPGVSEDTNDFEERQKVDLTITDVSSEGVTKPQTGLPSNHNGWQETEVLETANTQCTNGVHSAMPSNGQDIEQGQHNQVGATLRGGVDLERNAVGRAPSISLASIIIPECKPSAEDDEIHRQTFETWVELFNDMMDLAGVTDERTKFVVFKVKAGPRLLEIFRNTVSTLETPNAILNPFENAICRLQNYFSSSSYLMLQRRRLTAMAQLPEESDRSFVLRVAEAARYCGYGEGSIRDEVINVISQRARDKDVRAFAVTLIGVENNFTILMNKVREMLAIRINEESASKGFMKQEPALIAPIRADRPRQDRDRYKPYDVVRRRNTEDHRDRRIGNSQMYRQPRQDKKNFNKRMCWRCGNANHASDECWAAGKRCNKCGEVGHIQRVCRQAASKSRSESVRLADSNTKNIALVDKLEVTEEQEGLVDKTRLLLLGEHLLAAIASTEEGMIDAKVAGMQCSFLIDSGAQVNTLTEASFRTLQSIQEYSDGIYNLQYNSDLPLRAYATSGQIQVLATFEAHLFISDDRPVYLEKFYVVKESRSLLSRPTATRYSVLQLGLDVPVLTELEENPGSVRAGEIAVLDASMPFPKFNVAPVKIHYNREVPPCRNVFMHIPYALKPVVQERLQQLISADIIERVSGDMDTSFCSSMLIVPKGKEDFRLVIDLRGPNKYISRSPYRMPTHEQILTELNGACWFSTIDLSNAYYHIELDQRSRHLTNFCTEFGMFRFVRLPFGLSNAPDVFQETLERDVLGGCTGVRNYLDDVLVYGRTREEHDANLARVLRRLKEHNVRLNPDKCVFGSQSVKFLGFVLTPEGWLIENSKLSAIENFRTPRSCSEVKSFLGMITFFDKFILHRADRTSHLRQLAKADRFYWGKAEEEEFVYLKKTALKVIKKLGYYSLTDRTELFVDASPVGLGAVLVQFNDEGVPRIIACASKALTEPEQRYPHTQKEALAIVWGVERYSYYLLFRPFVVKTDSEANQYIFNTNHSLGKRAVSRASAWALRLQPYEFTVERVPGENNVADILSRLINSSVEAVPFEEVDDDHFLFSLDAGCMSISWNEIESISEGDSELEQVRDAIKAKVWPPELRKFEAQQKYLHTMGNLVFKDSKVVLPMSLRIKALVAAHEGHVGETSMKRIIRDFFWWPGMTKEVEQFLKRCETCAVLARKNPPLPLSPRDLPSGPWQILQIDFLSIPGCGSGEFLVVVDTYSRYISVVEMKRIDAESTNTALCKVFKLWGLPVIIQSDNGPPFQSTVFISFWEDKGVKVRKSIPLCPQTNGYVERQNQGITKAVSAARFEGKCWREALQRYVHSHNTLIPHSRLKVTPFELLVGFKFRGTFPCLWDYSKELDRTEVRERDAESKLISKKQADLARGAKESSIKVGDEVLMAQFRRNKTDPHFSSQRYRVIAREGARVVVMNNNGVQYSRNVQDVKLAPANADNETSGEPSTEVTEDPTERNHSVDRNDDLNKSNLEMSTEELPDSRQLRSRGAIKKPERFDDRFIYSVYQ